ncbi:MAG: undecaprenyl/decaprenyl-phosphate alpha-N-acetylglucosaminyl 1-phosphate transferase [Planctomycetes bacterium]|nr:undecaprenyl/decaprenyl-phosphate alpha-N-acetylglucosaminyl 1-phosphate transferase [Planctomycetota bacterium]
MTDLVPTTTPLHGDSEVQGLLFRPLDLLNSYAPVFLIAFTVTLLATPFVRKIAVKAGIIDMPDRQRKLHAYPVAYLGGLAVFLGVIVSLMGATFVTRGEAASLKVVPFSVVIGMVAIVFTGLADDIWKWDPRLKVAGQLVAAAALAIEDVGPRLAEGALKSVFGSPQDTLFSIGQFAVHNTELYYWVGTALVALFVIGGCNAANLIDGLDGLLSGTTSITAIGLLSVSLMMAMTERVEDPEQSLVGMRVALSLALLGATLGFLPYNFNPAMIFLGDCGSLLLGYLCVVIIMSFGEQGQTELVIAGLVIFGLPILDTILAIIRRKLAGLPFHSADSNHIHHLLKRSLGGVKIAVFALYGITVCFGVLGVAMAATRLLTDTRVLAIVSLAFAFFAFISAIAIKVARQATWQIQARNMERTDVDAAPGAASRDTA